jgi:hypothetical protein
MKEALRKTEKLRQKNRAREFAPVKTQETKIKEAAETKKLIDEWLAAGNIPYIGEHGPAEKPKTAYKPAHGIIKL